jgi:plastocyanin
VTGKTCGRLAVLYGLAIGLLATFTLEARPGEKGDGVIVINIKANSLDECFVKEGDKKTMDVTVKVGQKVRFVNKDDDTHTATSVAKDKDGKFIFDTGDLNLKESKEITFDADLFARAGGKAGGKVELPYLCEYHKKTMKSKIILVSEK